MTVMRWLGPVVLALLGVAACGPVAIRPEVLQQWIGRPATVLEKEWGEPSRQVSEGDLRILVYEELTQRTGQDFKSAQRNSPYAPREAGGGLAETPTPDRGLTVYVRSYLFWVNPAGVIVRTAVREP
jgi:hypothetical protein